jgi:excisionase family DNA binding protein
MSLTLEGQERALDIPGLASMLDISESHARRLLLRGELRGKKVGNVWRVHPETVREYLRGI